MDEIKKERSEGNEKVFSEKEVDLILKKAVEIQHREPSLEEKKEGLITDDLLSIAGDLGIKKEALTQAIAQVTSDSGQPVLFEKNKAVRTKTFTTSSHPDQKVLEDISRRITLILGNTGSGLVSDDSLMWQSDRLMSMSNGSFLQVNISCGEVETEVSIKDDSRMLAGGLYGGIGGGLGLGMGLGVGLGVGIGALGSILFSLIFPLCALAGSLGLSRFIFGKVLKDRNKKMGELVRLIKDCLDKKII